MLPPPGIARGDAGSLRCRRNALNEGFDLSGLYEEFRDEARQQLDILDAALLQAEQRGGPGSDLLAELQRALHTLKGNAGMLGDAPIRDAVHAVEEVFREPPAEWPQPLLDRLFEITAALRRAVEVSGTERAGDAFGRLLRLTPAGTDLAADAARGGPESGAASMRETSPVEPAATGTPAAGLGASDTVRVPFGKLDGLLNRTAGLVPLSGGLRQLLRTHRRELEGSGLRRPLEAHLDQLQRVSESLRSAVLDLRLVPVGRVLSRFPSVARDLAREEGKQVRVQLEGEATELDKSTVDLLAEPLLHLVRNAVAHGIEAPAEREAAGKEPHGTLRIAVTRSADEARIVVEDDGRGLDPARIEERARELGLVPEASSPAREDAFELIFRPGFSTRREPSTVSGRGIGLDVVRRRVAGLRGSLEVASVTDGPGTRFVLRLPVRVAIVPSLLFEADGARFAVPVAEVGTSLRAPAVHRLGGAEVIRLDGQSVPLARPARIFGWGPGRGEVPFAVVLRRGSKALAVAARRLLDQEDVVVKRIPDYLGQQPGVSGLTVTPGGRVLLLLDTAGLIQLSLESQRRHQGAL